MLEQPKSVLVFRAIKIISPPIVVVYIGPPSNLRRRREQLLENICAPKRTVFTFAGVEFPVQPGWPVSRSPFPD